MNPNDDGKATISSNRSGNASVASSQLMASVQRLWNTNLRNKQSSEEGGEARFWGCSLCVGKGVTGAVPSPACQHMFGWLSAC